MKKIYDKIPIKLMYSILTDEKISNSTLKDIVPYINLSTSHNFRYKLSDLFLDEIIRYYEEMPVPTVSAAYIVKNEEKCISHNLRKILPFVDEVIIVDTGSTDLTISKIKEINSRKIRIIEIEWKNNFSFARNVAINYATSQFVLNLDADESLGIDLYAFQKVLKFFSLFQIEKVLFLFQIVGLSKPFLSGRLIQNHSHLRYVGHVHEIILDMSNNDNLTPINLNIPIYCENRITDKKVKYYNTLLLEDINCQIEPSRWIYIYIRDNIDSIPDNFFDFIIEKVIIFNKETNNLEFVSNKFLYDKHNIIILWILRLIGKNNLTLGRQLVDFAKKHFNSSDLSYLDNLISYLSLKNQSKVLLNKILDDYKNKSHKFEHFDSKHLQSLLSVLLFENGYIEPCLKLIGSLDKNLELTCFNHPSIKYILNKGGFYNDKSNNTSYTDNFSKTTWQFSEQ